MPVMRPPRNGVSYSEALAAAYASAPEDDVVLDTIEFHHSTFVTDGGDPLPLRFVCDHVPLTATLEDAAPLNGGEAVVFNPASFEFKRPEETDSGALPEVEITVDNVGELVLPYLDAAKNHREPVRIIWRPYVSSDLSAPDMDPPLDLVVRQVSGDIQTMTLRAGFENVSDRRFPGIEYTPALFPQLLAR